MKLLSPIIPHTAEEAWKNMPAEREKACELSSFPSSTAHEDKDIDSNWEQLLKLREDVLAALEKKREEKLIGNSLEAKVILYPGSGELRNLLEKYEQDLPTLFITSQVEISKSEEPTPTDAYSSNQLTLAVKVKRAEGKKCERCWIYSQDVGKSETHPDICKKCVEAVARWEGGD